jgi:hypothetical protein
VVLVCWALHWVGLFQTFIQAKRPPELRMNNDPEGYRLKALVCERLSKNASNPAIRAEWEDIATEWHALSFMVARSAARIDSTGVH